MFQYFYRILDRHDKNTFVLAILSDDSTNYRPNRYRYSFFDTKLDFNYRTYKILEQDEEKLKVSDNPFAFEVLTALYSLEANESVELRFNSKVSLYRLLKSKKWNKESINKLFIFMDNILSLPQQLKKRFKFEIENIEKEREVAMGFSLKDSETRKLFIKDREIYIATKMFKAKKM